MNNFNFTMPQFQAASDQRKLMAPTWNARPTAQTQPQTPQLPFSYPNLSGQAGQQASPYAPGTIQPAATQQQNGVPVTAASAVPQADPAAAIAAQPAQNKVPSWANPAFTNTGAYSLSPGSLGANAGQRIGQELAWLSGPGGQAKFASQIGTSSPNTYYDSLGINEAYYGTGGQVYQESGAAQYSQTPSSRIAEQQTPGGMAGMMSPADVSRIYSGLPGYSALPSIPKLPPWIKV